MGKQSSCALPLLIPFSLIICSCCSVPAVLEVGVGTGRNMTLYPAGVQSVEGVDSSPEMLAQARAKYAQLSGSAESAAASNHASTAAANSAPAAAAASPASASSVSAAGASGQSPPPTSFLLTDASSLPRASCSFDTVVDTFGLCSYEDPALVLREMARVVRPASQGGRILLLEHGKSQHDWLNKLLLWQGRKHCRAWGCDLDRDIPRLVADSGLRIVEQQVLKQGTLRMYVLAPTKRSRELAAAAAEAAAEAAATASSTITPAAAPAAAELEDVSQ